MTKMPRTSDEYGVLITQLLEHRGIEAEKLEGSIVASVVPDVMHALMGALARYTGTRPMNVVPVSPGQTSRGICLSDTPPENHSSSPRQAAPSSFSTKTR